MFDRINEKIDERERVEVSQKQKHELKLLCKEPLNRSHILFSYNTVTGEVKRADVCYCDTVDFTTQEPLFEPRITVEKNCIYRQALNERNFIKILKREGYKIK